MFGKHQDGGKTVPINVGNLDAIARGASAVLLLIVAAFMNHLPVLSLAVAILALFFGGTALTRQCPVYRLLDVSTSRRTRS